jgi:hypothetical protein
MDNSYEAFGSQGGVTEHQKIKLRFLKPTTTPTRVKGR